MHESKHQIEVALAPVIKAHDYRKRRLTWYKSCPGTILIFHCEKNRWGANSYSFFTGICLNCVEQERIPLYYQCPILADLDKLVPNKFELRQFGDFDYQLSIAAIERISLLVELISVYALPWLESHSTLSQLSELAQADYELLLPKVRIFRHTYDYLRQLQERT